jgi:peptidoglycan/LPS O-acetylase OafA/YrhL
VLQTARKLSDHNNAFGFLRLLLASLVIVSHTPELVDGDRSRELLTRLFHTMSFGEFAVDGFFVVSGFLITKSYLTSSSPASYLRKRVARIYPAFILSSLVCVLIVGPMTGAHFKGGIVFALVSVIAHAALLLPPAMTHMFASAHYQMLNGVAWTIQYEFCCYLLVLILGGVGLLRSWRWLGAASVISLLMLSFGPHELGVALNLIPFRKFLLLGDRLTILRLGGMFLAGASFYLARDRISFTKPLVGLSLLCLALTLFLPHFANLGFAIFGSYSLLGIAALGSGTVLANINHENDISYGVYLYAWPIEETLIWLGLSKNLLALGMATFTLAAIAGTISWFVVEKRAMASVRSHRTSEYLKYAEPDGIPVSAPKALEG